jgi:integrase
VRDLSPISRRSTQAAVAIALDQLPVLLERMRNDPQLQGQDMVDLIEFLAATGCRVGEACGLQWDAVDLDAGTVTIRANAVRAHGQGVVVQDHAKTRAGTRTIAVPPNLVRVLRRREEFLWASGFVFPTSRGNIRDPRNTSKAWWEARDRLGFPTVSTHSFRKTIATALDEAGLSARAIAGYLGHENPSITQDVYMAKNTGGKRAAAALDSLLDGDRAAHEKHRR